MNNIRNIDDILETFFLCTSVPIQAFTADGSLIYAVGQQQKSDFPLSMNIVFKKITEKLKNKKSHSFVTLSEYDPIYFTATSIKVCHRYKDSFFLIGPYHTSPVEDSDVVYKPIYTIPHLMALLHSIEGDLLCCRSKKPIAKKVSNFYVKKAVDYIEDHYEEPMTLNHICEYLNISKCYFCTLFKKETGKTCSQFINDVRIEKSKELLTTKDYSILDIALSVGFNNQNYYTMAFKKRTGLTPLQYRKKN
ncbi:MAG: helix-turn-helix transcriptional regulator [Epulopiscium sp.]|nr:helix-turn-helix transcriptional regulator [Candidatus Epulonipiscium sp.]